MDGFMCNQHPTHISKGFSNLMAISNSHRGHQASDGSSGSRLALRSCATAMVKVLHNLYISCKGTALMKVL